MALGKDTATIDFRALRKLYNLWPNHTNVPRVLHFSAFHFISLAVPLHELALDTCNTEWNLQNEGELGRL